MVNFIDTSSILTYSIFFRSYLPGSKFHPFLLPIGFDLCTECYCHHQQYQIKCIRLTNTEKCGNRKTFDINDPFSDDFVELQENVRTQTKKEDIAVKILSEGGCKNPINARKPYINGSKYHPFIDSLGEYKCVTCKCQVNILRILLVILFLITFWFLEW